ncbi:MAG: ATP-grasp domain-containing protein [Gaiellaceae bacterium]
MARILVTDASRGSAIACIRSLGRRGMDVVAADELPRSPGFYSRYTSERVRYPPPAEAPEEAVAVLLRAARELSVDLIVPVTDEIILPLSEARARFAGVCRLTLPSPEALATAVDKRATLELAESLEIPVPRTRLVANADEALAAAAEIGWPVVLKPQSSRVYEQASKSAEQGNVAAFGVSYAADPETLTTQVGRLEGRTAVLVQEYFRGAGFGIELLMDRGRPLAAFQHRRLREVPITGGASSYRDSVPLDPVLLDDAVRLLGALDWTGLAMVEFKAGSEGHALMEVNGRIWGSLPLAVRAGMDFPARLVDLCLNGSANGPVRLDTAYETGVRSRNLELETAWIGSALRRGRRYPFLEAPGRREALRVALRLLNPADGYDVQSRDDPRPGLAEIAKIVGKISAKLRRAG